MVIAQVTKLSRHRVYAPLLGVGAVAAISAVVLAADPTTPGGILPPCPTNALLHINCPGCGATRALYSLLHGDIGAALHYNALGVLTMALVAYAFVAYVLGLWRGRRIRSWQHFRAAPWIALAAMLVWFVVRNLPFAPFSSLKV